MSTLYICPTPLGNLEDITLRVIRVLKSVDLIAAEDTRHSRRLLNHFEIETQMVSYHQYSSVQQVEKLVDRLLAGQSVALISDAGTPGISDPGQPLIDKCIQAGINIESLPGPNAAITALAVSGFPLAAFSFYGFLPRKGQEAVAALADIPHPVILYESPRRVEKLLERLVKLMPDRPLFIAREITKLHQQYIRGTVSQVLNDTDWEEVSRGEFTIVLGPWSSAINQPDDAEISSELETMIQAGLTTRDAVQTLSKRLGMPKNRIYKLANRQKK